MRQGRLLALAAIAVAFAAADTYVVVLALPEMMAGVGLSVEQLQEAAPIVSAFLLGYVAMLPLIGSVADRRGRVPVLTAGLVVFAFGSLLTALAYGLGPMIAGRFLQGLGGGALVPATLALVADLYPAERRGVPLGVVSAIQEAGSLLGPLLGAVVLAVADWRAIFAINLLVAAVLAVAVERSSSLRYAEPGPAPRRARPGAAPRAWPDPIGMPLLLVAAATGALVFVEPTAMMRDLTWGRLYIPITGESRWSTPLGVTCLGAAVLFALRCTLARRTRWPLVDVRGWAASLREVDVPGALLLAGALAGLILTFATADPQVQAIAPGGWWYLAGAVLALAAFLVRQRTAATPLLPRGALRARPAWGAVLVSLLVGAALVAALIDVPLFARTTVYPDSQLDAALVLVRFLVALPIGAIAGGRLTRRASAGAIACAGLVLAAAGLAWMARWDVDALRHATATVPLLLCGLGFGVVLAPVNAAVLAATDAAIHGLAGALVVVARMIGMLVGLSTLTTLGLRHYYAAQADLPSMSSVCGTHGLCDRYQILLQRAGIAQEHTVFGVAAVVAVAGAVLALGLLRGAATREVDTREALQGLG
ncbi:MFS transporter [Nocardioides sp. BP30]|uniref:MFS transporter n=1 Tax=Nocardioides sp. BP30 TaxID=3036374 RepID=UPI0024698443|nr:MFS transporter [Nocardioides sp. BP30]WGL53942.1 MFS transporter [Nocardioides sp. BP30]